VDGGISGGREGINDFPFLQALFELSGVLSWHSCCKRRKSDGRNGLRFYVAKR
jgi:hypothetical protein